MICVLGCLELLPYEDILENVCPSVIQIKTESGIWAEESQLLESLQCLLKSVLKIEAGLPAQVLPTTGHKEGWESPSPPRWGFPEQVLDSIT